jgi:two-component system response regulator HydG
LREDLYYRLNVVRLDIPPLRDRPDDVPLLARHFMALHAERNNRAMSAISPEALEALQNWSWPGNVRELENAIERAVVLSRDEVLDPSDLPPALRNHHDAPDRLVFSVGSPLKSVERRMIEATLRQVGGDKVLAADLLGITARTIYRREAEWREEDGVPAED